MTDPWRGGLPHGSFAGIKTTPSLFRHDALCDFSRCLRPREVCEWVASPLRAEMGHKLDIEALF